MPSTAGSTIRAFTASTNDPYARGAELGHRHAAAVHASLASYLPLWAAYGVNEHDADEVGEAVLEPVRTFAPGLFEEMRGIADGAGLSLREVAALNARTELLARGSWPAEECTTYVWLPPDGSPPQTMQTWDWHESQADTWFVWSLPQADGAVVHSLTEYGIVGKIGVSSRDLSVHFNALGHRDDTGDGGVPVHVVARRILDEAHSVSDAVQIAGEAKVSASSAVTVTGRSDEGSWSTAMLELHPGGPTVIQGEGEYAVHTNHFLNLPDSDQVHRPGSTTRDRLNRVKDRVAARRPSDRAAMAALLADHEFGARSVCAHPAPDAALGEQTMTLAVAATEPATGSLSVHAGSACAAVERGAWFSSRPGR